MILGVFYGILVGIRLLVNRLNNSVLGDKGALKMDFGANRTPIEGFKKMHFQDYTLETFILVLMESGTKSHGEPFFSVKISSYLCSYFWSGSSKMHFLREQLWSAPMFWNVFFEGAINLVSWFMAAD